MCRDCGILELSPERGVFIEPLLLGIRDLCGRGDGKSVRTREDGPLQGECPPDTARQTHLRTHRDWSSMYGACTTGSSQTGFLHQGRGGRATLASSTPNQKAICI